MAKFLAAAAEAAAAAAAGYLTLMTTLQSHLQNQSVQEDHATQQSRRVTPRSFNCLTQRVHQILVLQYVIFSFPIH
jgi:hypothetical protein